MLLRTASPRWDGRTESSWAGVSPGWEPALEGPSVPPAASLLQASILPAPWVKMSFECGGCVFITALALRGRAQAEAQPSWRAGAEVLKDAL